MILLTDDDVKSLLDGQSVFYPFSRRGVTTGEVVMVIPIKSSRTGRVVRYAVYSENPNREKGDVRKP